MKSKTEKAIDLFRRGYLKESLSIFKTFRMGFASQQRRTLEIACDCLNGRLSFYQQLGVDVNMEILRSKSIIQSKYGV